MNKNFLLSLMGIILLGFGLYFFYFKPHNIATTYCEKQYEYHPATIEAGAYHTAVGISGPITRYDSRREAMKMCIKYHVSFFRKVGDIYE